MKWGKEVFAVYISYRRSDIESLAGGYAEYLFPR
jgi:hypothetical protein